VTDEVAETLGWLSRSGAVIRWLDGRVRASIPADDDSVLTEFAALDGDPARALCVVTERLRVQTEALHRRAQLRVV